MATKPTCHPERKHAARGLCLSCYRRQRYATDKAYREECKASGLNYYRKHSKRVAKRIRTRYRQTDGRLAVFERRIKHRWGMSLDDYRAALDAQGGVCAICGLPPEPQRRLAIDHSHTTGKRRGLLHRLCNLILGNAKDNPAVLDASAAYLRRYENDEA